MTLVTPSGRPGDAVRVRVPAKVNLQLSVGPPGRDGYHELVTVFHAVSLYDEVTVRPADRPSVVVTGEGEGDVPLGQANLAIRAAAALSRAAGRGRGAPPVRIEIRKRIPVAAGLAGGSADAAAALVACNELWRVGASQRELSELAAKVGSDVPFALIGGTAVGQGRGERLTTALVTGVYHWVLAFAAGGLPTPDVYAACDRLRAARAAAGPAGMDADPRLADGSSGDLGESRAAGAGRGSGAGAAPAGAVGSRAGAAGTGGPGARTSGAAGSRAGAAGSAGGTAGSRAGAAGSRAGAAGSRGGAAGSRGGAAGSRGGVLGSSAGAADGAAGAAGAAAVGRAVVPAPRLDTDLMAALRSGDPAAVGPLLSNDLQPAALSLLPVLRRALAAGREFGALGAIVSGSGPTCAFLAANASKARDLAVALTGAGVCRAVAQVTGPAPGASVIEPRGRA